MTTKIRTLQLIHLGICIGVIALYVFFGINSSSLFKLPSFDNEALIFIGIPVAAFVMSNFLFKNQLKQVDKSKPLEENLPIYQTASIMRWALLEGAAISIVVLKPELILFGILVIAYIIFLRPTEQSIKSDLNYLD